MKTLHRKINIIIALLLLIVIYSGYSQQNFYTQNLEKSPTFNIPKSGELLFDQMYNPGMGYIMSQKYTNQSSNLNNCMATDDFVVPPGETWGVFSIGIYGAYWAGNTGGGDTLNVFILNDNNGFPGDTLYEIINHTDFYTSEETIGDNIFTYFEIFLPEAANLAEGAYWLSAQMVANENIVGQWGWRDHEYETTIYGEEWHWINPKDGFGTGAVNWTPASTVVGPWLLWELSFGLFGEPTENDLSLLSISSPEDFYNEPQSELVPVLVAIKNEGINPQTGFNMKYDIDGNEVIENVGSIIIQPNEVYEYTFAQGLDLSDPGAYDLTVSTFLTGDENPENDDKSMAITVYDPTIYPMPSMQTTSITACSGTFTDAGGLEGDLVVGDWGTMTIYPATPGAKIRLEFIQFDIHWSSFWIYDGENTNAPELGFWENLTSPGTITATYENTSGALTVKYIAQVWTPFDDYPGWAANISCYEPPEDDFAILDLEILNPVVNAGEFVTFTTILQNTGTLTQSKELTFTANDVVFGVVPTGDVAPSEFVTLEMVWNPDASGNYTILASIPEDEGEDDNNIFSLEQEVFPTGYFYEGFELQLFPPDGWSQTSTFWTRYNEVPYEGNGYAWYWGDYGLTDTLISPLLHIEESATLQFFAYSSAWWPGEMDLCWINGETGEAQLIEEVSLSWFDYNVFQIDVSEAAGNNYLAWVGKWNPMGGLGEMRLDAVEGLNGISWFYHEHDLKAYKLRGNITPEMNGPSTYSFDIKNMGTQSVGEMNYSIKLIQEPGIELTSVPGVFILPFETKTINIDYTFPTSGLKDIYVYVDYSSDEDILNNTSTNLIVHAQQAGTIPIEIGEDQLYNNNQWHPIGLASISLSQTLYMAEDIGEPNTITGIMYNYDYRMNYPLFDIPVKLWFTETNLVNMADSMFSVADTALVYDGYIDFYPGENGVYIPLDFPFAYEGSNLVITAFQPTPDYYGENRWQYSNSENIMVRHYNGFDQFDPENLTSIWHTWDTQYANITFFKYDLTGQYCIPQTLNGTILGDYVDGVSINEIENLSTGSPGGPAYSNYSNMSTNLEKGRVYDLTIQAETNGTEGSVAAWIDFNADGDMDDEGERIVHINSDESSQEISASILIPENANLGVTILRIRNSSNSELFNSCEAVDYGETEDYGINIIETQQVYNPVMNLFSEVDYDGNVELSWEVPENSGTALVEGFELSNWPPQNGWEVKMSTSLNGALSDPVGLSWEQNTETVYNGSQSAVCSDEAPDFNWLISPFIQIFNVDEMSFMLNYSSDESGYSKFYVRAEVDGEWVTILEYTDEVNYYNNYDEKVTIDLSEYAGKMARFAFVTEYNDAYPVAIDDININGVLYEFSGIESLTIYELYRNNELISEITDPSVVSYSEQVSFTENYEYCLTSVYEVGQSEEECSSAFYYAPLTPPVNVTASAVDNDVNVKWIAPDAGIVRFFDDFENLNAGEQVACQDPENWTTWTLEPCSIADPFISSEMPYSGDKSVVIEGVSDLLRLEDELIEEGKYSINFRMLIPEGFNAYFNVLQDHDITLGALWGFQAFFDQDNYGEIDAGGYSAAVFTYEYDQWMYVELVIDIDNDWAQFLLNGELIHEWQWSKAITGNGGWNTLDAVDFYAWDVNGPPKFFIDDYQMIQLYESSDLFEYNVYRDDEFIGITSSLEMDDMNIVSGSHNYCVSALYDEGESSQVCDWVNVFGSPENFAVELINANDVLCTWDEIVSEDLIGYAVYREDEDVSGLVTETEWTDMDVDGGTHIYYVIAVFENGESEPSNSETITVLIAPANLVANPVVEDIVLEWESVGTVVNTELIKLYQHDNIPVNGHYQIFNFGYGVVYDLTGYSEISLESIDFHHASWGIPGAWVYRIHVYDWNTLSEIAVLGPFQTTGDDTWEYDISLGSIPGETNMLAVFLEPMSNTPEDAYPVISADEFLEGYSVIVDLNDLNAQTVSIGDLLLDLWIMADENDEKVLAKKVNLSNLNNQAARNSFNPVDDEYNVKQNKDGGKFLSGYNVYYAYDQEPFEMIDFTIDTTYTHTGMALIDGMHKYYVTSMYDEGESEPSAIATVLIDGITDVQLDVLSLYPNPIADLLFISTSEKINKLEILNITGQLIIEIDNIGYNYYEVDLKDKPSGIYFITVETLNGIMNKRIIKQ